jgi:hypothetical protein
VNETWLNLGTQSSGARLVIKRVNGARGIGHARLLFNAEVTNRDASLAGLPLSFRGRVDVLGVGGADTAVHLASLAAFDREPVLGSPGVEDSFTLVADLDDRQLQIIEEHRIDALRLRLWLPGQTFREGRFEPFHANNIDYTVSQSEWLAILEQVGYARRHLVELDVPTPESDPKLAEAVAHFGQARRHYGEGEWRLCVESLRQCLAVLVGKQADDEDDISDVQAALKNLQKAKSDTKIGYNLRSELARQVLKFYCDIGAHPEVEETRRQHARAALMMVSGLLESLRAA